MLAHIGAYSSLRHLRRVNQFTMPCAPMRRIRVHARQKLRRSTAAVAPAEKANQVGQSSTRADPKV
jgi:hypothetical protein